jgi:hypothetical protein
VTGVTECGEAEHEGRRKKSHSKMLKTGDLGAAEAITPTVNFGAMTSGE